LRSRDAGHKFHGQERNAGAGEIGVFFERRERLAEADYCLAGAKSFEIGAASFGIGPERSHLDDHIRLKNVAACGYTRSARCVLFILKSGFSSRGLLDNYANSQFRESLASAWNKRHAAFAWESFTRHSYGDSHEPTSVIGRPSEKVLLRLSIGRGELIFDTLLSMIHASDEPWRGEQYLLAWIACQTRTKFYIPISTAELPL
jgi:hypothetical protein